VVGLVNGSVFHAVAPAMLIGLLVVSWTLRPQSRVLATASATGSLRPKGAVR
jgi:hypothetical protein